MTPLIYLLYEAGQLCSAEVSLKARYQVWIGNEMPPIDRGLSHSQSSWEEADPGTENDNWEARH